MLGRSRGGPENCKPEGDASPSGFFCARLLIRTLRDRAVTQASCACHFAERNCGESKNL